MVRFFQNFRVESFFLGSVNAWFKINEAGIISYIPGLKLLHGQVWRPRWNITIFMTHQLPRLQTYVDQYDNCARKLFNFQLQIAIADTSDVVEHL